MTDLLYCGACGSPFESSLPVDMAAACEGHSRRQPGGAYRTEYCLTPEEHIDVESRAMGLRLPPIGARMCPRGHWPVAAEIPNSALSGNDSEPAVAEILTEAVQGGAKA